MRRGQSTPKEGEGGGECVNGEEVTRKTTENMATTVNASCTLSCTWTSLCSQLRLKCKACCSHDA